MRPAIAEGPVPFVPSAAPFTPEQRAWLNGYLAGLFANANAVETPGESSDPGAAKAAEPLLVLFGSQTGGAESLAKRFAAEAAKRGFAPRVFALNDYEKAEFTRASRLVIISSTWGEGDPPENALRFWQHLNCAAAPRLEHLHYAVLALGDHNYSDFCGAGKKFDERLEQLGAKRMTPRGECDVDFEATASAWIEELWPKLMSVARSQLSVVGGPSSVPNAADAETPATSRPDTWNRANPFPARIIASRKLNGVGSAKDTRHIEISLKGAAMHYEVGDALGVLPTNCPVLVEELLATLGFKGEETVHDPTGRDTSLHEALLRHYAITQPALPLLKAAAEHAKNFELLGLLSPEKQAELEQWLLGRDIVDVLRLCAPAKFAPAEFIGSLRKLQPRLYSISSSPRAHPAQAHLTVAVVRYDAHGRIKKGVCSCFLADRVLANATPVPVFVQASRGFRLPPSGDTPIIMIGPGTGVAPFRAFLEERQTVGAKGPNWLFFGDQCRAWDFLYREELQALQADGTLTRLDTAFSRDQQEKIYVQHRMLENAGEFWDWLERGAHVYVCGDARRMAKDVDTALHRLIQKAGGKNADQSAEYVLKLKSEERYQRDVY